MLEAQKLALNTIYAAPSQDDQYRFSLVEVTGNYPVKKTIKVYEEIKNLPNQQDRFLVFAIGNITPSFLNLINKDRSWFRDTWVNVEEDMNNRNFIVQFYNSKGVVFPRKNFFYSPMNNGLLVSFLVDRDIQNLFGTIDCKYMRVYSNEVFDSDLQGAIKGQDSIKCESKLVRNNVDKQKLIIKFNTWEEEGGKCLVYVNGYFTDKVRLGIPDNSLIEVVYDKSILNIERYKLSTLRTFLSTKDNRVKYFLYRTRQVNYMQYEDDLEIYITEEVDNLKLGTYYYQHKNYALTNVTDKDFALDSIFVNNQATELVTRFGGNVMDKDVVVLTRKSAVDRVLVHNASKLHELYKLPLAVQEDLMSNVNTTLPIFRAEYLEDSHYFKLMASTSLKNITPLLATQALGYNGLSYYLGNTPNQVPLNANVEVPFLYRTNSLVYEYNASGKVLGYYPTYGPMYTVKDPLAAYVEFLQGTKINTFKLHLDGDSIPLLSKEFRLIASSSINGTRVNDWVDITNNEDYVTYVGNEARLTVTPNMGVRITYENDVICEDKEVSLDSGVLTFPIDIFTEDTDNSLVRRLDYYFANTEVFMNDYRLTYKLDFFYSEGVVIITNKTHIDYTKSKQKVHIRLTNPCLLKETINAREIRGFVNHGVLTRNNYYDITDDKVLSVFVDGKLVPRDNILFSETDNTVRLTSPTNGLPYTVNRRLISLYPANHLTTRAFFIENEEKDTSISNLFNVIYPEPDIGDFNIIQDHYYVYSPIVSKVIVDLKNNTIDPDIYTKPYNDTDIQNLINTRYKTYYELDPIREDYPNNLVEVHPHAGNSTILVTVHQYRFLTNLIRIITNNQPDRINISGYLAIDNTLPQTGVNVDPVSPGGIMVP